VVGRWESRGADIQDVVYEDIVAPNFPRATAEIELGLQLSDVESDAILSRCVQFEGVVILATFWTYWTFQWMRKRRDKTAGVLASLSEYSQEEHR